MFFPNLHEGNGNPLQCSCLENPRDGEAWQAAISGVTQSRTRLKRLSSSSSSKAILWVIDFASLIGLSKYYYVVIFYMQFSLVLSLTLVITISLFSLTQEHKICDENSLYVTPGNQWTFISAVCIYINFFLLCGLSDVNYAIGLA